MKRHFRDENGMIERQEIFEPDEDLQLENSMDKNEFEDYVAKLYDKAEYRITRALYW